MFPFKTFEPFLNKKYITFALSIKFANFFLNLKSNKLNPDANAGKYQLKKCSNMLTSKHAHDKKIGFHAPVSKVVK